MNPLLPTTSGRLRRPWVYWGATIAAMVVAACTTPISQEPMTPDTSESKPDAGAQPTAASTNTVSNARTPRDYRRDAASHLYTKNSNRIYAGKLPPMLYAIGVLQVDINKQGAVTALHWMRAPSHAPEVVAEIERAVRQAAPYPTPAKMGRVTYTDTWLWDRSGKFQLDTLTEGQL